MNEILYKNIANLFPQDLCETCYLHKVGTYTKEDCVTYGKRLCKREIEMCNAVETAILDAGYLPVEPVEIEGLTEDGIDNLRMLTMNGMGKVADKTWWDICAAYEKMYGEDAALTAEQFLIDLTNKTGLKVSQFTIDKIKQQGKLYRRVE